MIRAALIGLAAAAIATPAMAMIEVPARAVWSLTDVDGMQFCDKCDPDTVTSATRVENFRRTILDTVAMGARAIIVHAGPGSGRVTRVGDFAAALAAYNGAVAAGDKACMALMFADYGTSSPNAEIDALYVAAWTGGGAHYCSIAGAPVIASLEDRPDRACAVNKYINIFNRLKALPAGAAVAAAHWVAAFGEVAEYTAWDTDCRGKAAITGVALTYSFLEMANDDPAFAASATSRQATVAAGGGRYILGLPSASASNCGDYCGGNDATAYRHTGFGGFTRLMAAWRAGVENVAFTYGPGGPAAKDQFASSARKCDANDLVTAASVCAALPAREAALVPGVPR